MKSKKEDYSEYQCPQGGRWSDDEITLIRRTKAEYNYGKALEFGGTPLDWVEYHQCPDCGINFSFDNSNC